MHKKSLTLLSLFLFVAMASFFSGRVLAASQCVAASTCPKGQVPAGSIGPRGPAGPAGRASPIHLESVPDRPVIGFHCDWSLNPAYCAPAADADRTAVRYVGRCPSGAGYVSTLYFLSTLQEQSTNPVEKGVILASLKSGDFLK